MKNEIIGNRYRYIIDTSYGINKDGFIAIGTESVVYKGLKTELNGGLQFSCVLKFKPKYVLVDGKVVNRLEIFKNVIFFSWLSLPKDSTKLLPTRNLSLRWAHPKKSIPAPTREPLL